MTPSLNDTPESTARRLAGLLGIQAIRLMETAEGYGVEMDPHRTRKDFRLPWQAWVDAVRILGDVARCLNMPAIRARNSRLSAEAEYQRRLEEERAAREALVAAKGADASASAARSAAEARLNTSICEERGNLDRIAGFRASTRHNGDLTAARAELVGLLDLLSRLEPYA